MNNFDFLNNVTLVPMKKERKSSGKVAMQRVPDNGADLRLFKDGSIYPSNELVSKYDLEYNEEGTGNGFDIIDSRSWAMYPKDAKNVVFISAVSKKEGLVDLFSSARKTDDGLVSVLEQGSKTFGNTLIKMLEEVYETTLFTSSKYVDLKIVEDVSISSPDDIFFVPKMSVKGENKGKMTTKRRENLVINPLVIYTDMNKDEDIEVGKEDLSEDDNVA